MTTSISIIGAGIAGLSAGCYAQMNGYQAHIFELHNQPGGVVTSWRRHGYLFDGCIEFLNGSNPTSRWNRMWQELGAVRDHLFVNHSEFLRVHGQDGRELVLYADIDRLEEHLLDISPADSGLIRKMTGTIRALAAFDPPLDVRPLDMILEMPQLLKWLKAFNNLKKISISQFAAQFKDPLLRFGLPTGTPPNIPASLALSTFAFQSRQNAGCPTSGSLAFAQSIARRFSELGGQIHYGARVNKILVEPCQGGRGSRAVGVRLSDGEEYHSDWVISAADGYSTIYSLLEGRFVNQEIANRYAGLKRTPPSIQISLGVRRDLSGEPHSQVDLLPKPLLFAGENHSSLWYQILNYSPTFAPAGKTVIVSRIRSNYAFWQAFAGQTQQYEAEKQAAASALISHLETRYPGLTSDVEVIDIATPLTFERYTANREGVYQSFAMTPETVMYAQDGMDPTLPGLDRFFQIGQWILPNGGVFPAARSGRETLRKICAADRRRFITTTPA